MHAHAQHVSEAEYLMVVNDMLTDLAPRSAHDAAAIRDIYRPYMDLLALGSLTDIEQGIATGGLVPLPADPRFNVRVRLDGAGAVGELDVPHQDSYVSARAETIGCLLDVASRVKSGPIEVTSLVRHLEYQDELRVTNFNATTEVPTHALGMAFDIAMVNTPLERVLELRNVLRQMADAGDILVIGERQQLVFHVVPQPSRLGWYRDVYAAAVSGRPWPAHPNGDGPFTPEVIAAINSLQPMPEFEADWWAAENVPVDLPVSVHADVIDGRAPGYLAAIGELLSSTWHMLMS